MFASDGIYDPELEPTLSKDGFVTPEALPHLAGWGPFFPVWLYDDRITVSRTSSVSSAREIAPGIAVLLYPTRPDDEESAPRWHTQSDNTYQFHSLYERVLPQLIRVIDARTGRVVFTSALPESILRSARREVEQSPVTYSIKTNVLCGPRRGFSRLYSTSSSAPYEEYFGDRPVAVPAAVRYRNHLRRDKEEAALIQVLNPDFWSWFWARTSGLPELPHPEAMCNEDNQKLWTLLMGQYL